MIDTAVQELIGLDLPFAGDPVAVMAGMCAGSGTSHVLYESDGRVCWAEGEVAVVELGGDGVVSVTLDGRRSPFPAVGTPLDTLAKALAAAAGTGRWRAYGWATFELSHLLAGRLRHTGPVVRLTLPEREIVVGGGVATLRARSDEELALLRERLTEVVPVDGAGLLDVDLDQGADSYRRAVADAVGTIQTGLLDKVILSRRVAVAGPVDLPATYLAGRRANNPVRSFLLRQGSWEAAGFSPEIVATVTPAGTVVTQPLAGTRALVGDAVVDRSRREELSRDPKEIYEHVISVRLSAAELAEVCAPESIRIGDFMSVRERGSVQHLGSEVTGQLRHGATCWDALAVLFPAVTASGVPKAEACRLIEETEADPRGLYSGAVLTADSDGALDVALVLRSVFRAGGHTWLRAGAGVVPQSDPDRELEETREKLRSVSRYLVRGVS